MSGRPQGTFSQCTDRSVVDVPLQVDQQLAPQEVQAEVDDVAVGSLARAQGGMKPGSDPHREGQEDGPDDPGNDEALGAQSRHCQTYPADQQDEDKY